MQLSLEMPMRGRGGGLVLSRDSSGLFFQQLSQLHSAPESQHVALQGPIPHRLTMGNFENSYLPFPWGDSSQTYMGDPEGQPASRDRAPKESLYE